MTGLQSLPVWMAAMTSIDRSAVGGWMDDCYDIICQVCSHGLIMVTGGRSAVRDWSREMAFITSNGRSAVMDWSGWMVVVTSNSRSAVMG